MNVPKLRFKEFSGEWEKKRLGEITKVISLKNKEDAQLPIYSINNKIGFVPQDEQFENIDGVSRGYDTSLYKVVIPNMFAYNPARINVGSIGYSANLNNVMISSLYVCFVLTGYNDDSFFWQWFKSKKFNVLVNRFTEGGVRQYLFYENLARIKTFVPLCSEQEKIAMFLSVVDSKIGNQQAIVESLEKQKKALMQKIFSQELRFKDEDGNDFPAWEEKKLREIAKVYDGTHQTPNYVDSGIKFVSVEDIQSLYDSNKFITVEAFNSNFKVYPQKGDVLMTRIGDIGTATIVDRDEPIAYYVSLGLMKPFGVSGEFLLQYIRSNAFQHELWRRTLHIAFPKKINKNEIGECLVMVPCTREQEKIAELLSSYDDKIEVEKKSLEKWQQIKKGLLQQMFV